VGAGNFAPEIEVLKIVRRNCFARFDLYWVQTGSFVNYNVYLISGIIPPKE
jgi:hypothetical protein